jgi:adenosine deaminase
VVKQTRTMAPVKHYLDYNERYTLGLKYDPASKKLTAEMTTRSAPNPRFMANVKRLLSVEQHGDSFTLKLGDEPIGTYHAQADGTLTLDPKTYRPLTVSETRRMGTFYGSHAELYPHTDKALAEKAKTAVTTDFHTHSSGQITADGLIEIAKAHDVYYPVHLLKEAGIKIEIDSELDKLAKKVPRIPFPPLEPQTIDNEREPTEVLAVPLAKLKQSDIAKLALKMQMPMDAQATYSEMENDAYRFRYPITKQKGILKDSLKKVASEYAKQGIHYAEIAYVGLDEKDLFRNLHEAMAEMEAENKSTPGKYANLRFLVGLPRNWSINKIRNSLDTIKLLARSPYITGIDLLGYETNKTADFMEALDEFAAWAEKNQPNFIFRAHAGENDKNLANVREFLKLTSHHHLRTRIGHGLYGMDDKETLDLAAEMCADRNNPLLTLEFNPDSNIALNNVDDIRQIPFASIRSRDIPFVIGSDSAGTYGTDARQLGLAGMYGGLNSAGFDALKHHQQRLVAQQNAEAQRKIAKIPGWETAEGRQHFINQVVGDLVINKPMHPESDEKPDFSAKRKDLKDKGVLVTEDDVAKPNIMGARKPIAIVGASGSTWKRIPAQQQHDISVAMDMVIHAIDPEKAYIVQGRSKADGLGKLLRESIKRLNNGTGDAASPPLKTLGIIAEPQYDRQETFGNLTHLIEVNKLLQVADKIVDHVVSNNGALIAAGGAAFTRDIILKADRRMEEKDKGALMLMDCPDACTSIGASGEKSRVLHEQYRVVDGKQIITNLFNLYPEIFPKGFNPQKEGVLKDLEDAAKGRVGKYRMDTPEPDGHMVTGGETVSVQHGKEGGGAK